MDDATTTGVLMDGSMIRWIAFLPLVAALVHGVLIGLVRAQISERLVFGVSVSAIVAALGFWLLLAGVELFRGRRLGLFQVPGARLQQDKKPW